MGDAPAVDGGEPGGQRRLHQQAGIHAPVAQLDRRSTPSITWRQPETPWAVTGNPSWAEWPSRRESSTSRWAADRSPLLVALVGDGGEEVRLAFRTWHSSGRSVPRGGPRRHGAGSAHGPFPPPVPRTVENCLLAGRDFCQSKAFCKSMAPAGCWKNTSLRCAKKVSSVSFIPVQLLFPA